MQSRSAAGLEDSDTDWEHEALEMHKVYKQEFLKISTDAAVDAQGGLFQLLVIRWQ
ncbi:MAG: hypothetical protein Q9197_003403 [Variospora fuerteventurae]